MSVGLITVMTFGSICAAGGQILFKIGADGRDNWSAFLNLWVASGVVVYGIGAVCWVHGLSKAGLITVYPFTVLTAVVVYGAAITIFGERPTVPGMVGIVLIMFGLYLISHGSS